MIRFVFMGLVVLSVPVRVFSWVPLDSLWQTGHPLQLEIGGPHVGAEYHYSSPLPSRISFYTPVANSLDQSTDYWQRHRSRPLRIILSTASDRILLNEQSFLCRYTPWTALFEKTFPTLTCRLDTRPGYHLPFISIDMTLVSTSPDSQQVTLEICMVPELRSSHTYARLSPHTCEELDAGFSWSFPQAAADSTALFIVQDSKPSGDPWSVHCDSLATLGVTTQLAPRDSLRCRLLIGTCALNEQKRMIATIRQHASEDIQRYSNVIRSFIDSAGICRLGEPQLESTRLWSLATLQSNRHMINGYLLPMPCPAEYNFFFTHDALLTDLGALWIDPDRVRTDLDFLLSHSRPDSVLPHAYYWKDSTYTFEWCAADNWNPLWFIIVAGSYYLHSGDQDLITRLSPVLVKSAEAIRQHDKGVIYSSQPDWWDIGDVYGARTYMTCLAIRAYEAMAVLAPHLPSAPAGPVYIRRAERLKKNLMARLWDDSAGYLMNDLGEHERDPHLYAGSLLAGALTSIDSISLATLVSTAETALLDPKLGIRNVAPADFDTLADRYRFNGPEAGAAYRYLNGGIWSQNTVWYIESLLNTHDSDNACRSLKTYLTLSGVEASPGGQASFYEYRRADRQSPGYGRIDKPSFLWFAGFYLHALYRLAGLRENAWNLSFSPRLPSHWTFIDYEVFAHGRQTHIRYRGSGEAFRRIVMDGVDSPSALWTRPARLIELERGVPLYPYLAGANCTVTECRFSGRLLVSLRGYREQTVSLTVHSPTLAMDITTDSDSPIEWSQNRHDRFVKVKINTTLTQPEQQIEINFKDTL